MDQASTVGDQRCPPTGVVIMVPLVGEVNQAMVWRIWPHQLVVWIWPHQLVPPIGVVNRASPVGLVNLALLFGVVNLA